jgi:arginase
MLSNKPISVLGVCSGLGQRQSGLELAPKVLRDSGLLIELSKNQQSVRDLGDLYPCEAGGHVATWKLIEEIRLAASGAMNRNEVLVTLGGDHSIAIGTVQASLLRNPNIKVVWIDAHGDINTPQTSMTGNLHGMPLASLLGLYDSPEQKIILKPENLFLIGVRDLDVEERKFIESLSINMLSSDQLAKAPDSSLSLFKEWLENDSSCQIHLSFDIDAMDPALAPATGLPVPAGLSLDSILKFLTLIGDSQRLISLDLVEINPLHASPNELAETIACAKTILTEALFGNRN